MSNLTDRASYRYGLAIAKAIAATVPVVPVDTDQRTEIAVFIVGLRHGSIALNRLLTTENLRAAVRYFDEEYQAELYGVIGRIEETETPVIEVNR
jgi:hypothetical protein